MTSSEDSLIGCRCHAALPLLLKLWEAAWVPLPRWVQPLGRSSSSPSPQDCRASLQTTGHSGKFLLSDRDLQVPFHQPKYWLPALTSDPCVTWG